LLPPNGDNLHLHIVTITIRLQGTRPVAYFASVQRVDQAQVGLDDAVVVALASKKYRRANYSIVSPFAR
jgi:hypothetical protein